MTWREIKRPSSSVPTAYPDDDAYPVHVNTIQTSHSTTSQTSLHQLVKHFTSKISIRNKVRFSTYPVLKARQSVFQKAAREDTEPFSADTDSIPSGMDLHPHANSPHPPITSEPLLCPPKALVECMFPDTVVFHSELLPTLKSPPFSATASLPMYTVQALFKQLCVLGYYSEETNQWTSKANAPDFKKERLKDTELNFATFVETIVLKTLELIGTDFVPRTWVASDKDALSGSLENRKPDIFVRSKGAHDDWRVVDCVVEMKNGDCVDQRASLGQIAERARTLFNVQDDRRFALLIRILQDRFSYTAYDRGGSITAPFTSINRQALLFYRLILGISFAERRYIGYDVSVTGSGASRRLRLDLACDRLGLQDLEVQLVLHMTGRVNSRGTTVRLLKVVSEAVANFYGDRGAQYMSLPGVKPGDNNFGIVSKDSWEEDEEGALSEGSILQLLHAKGVQGVSWCLDEKPVPAPDPPAPPMPVVYQPQFIDNTMYIRSRWGVRRLRVSSYATQTMFRKDNLKTAIKDHAMSALTRITGSILSILPGGNMKTESKALARGRGMEQDFPSPSATASISHTPQIINDDLKDCKTNRHFITRSHVRNYLYPVGTPIYWFTSLLELLCVLRDLLESHKQACSVSANSGRGSYSILHRDMSPWNFMMVSQRRSDFPVEREWASQELQTVWDCTSRELRDPLRRGLLIDWGFAALESSGPEFVDLTDEDIQVFEPVEWEARPQEVNDDYNEDNLRHCLSPASADLRDTSLPTYTIPPLWELVDGTLTRLNTQTFVRGAKHGNPPLNWVNETLRKNNGQLSNATGTWPFVCLDMMVAWLLDRQLAIQYWHDLETLFISFTALCMWFECPFYPKDIQDEKNDMAWIFQSHDPTDLDAVHRKWEMFRPHFEKKILGNLSSYFNCDAIKSLLSTLRDMCIPPTWDEDVTGPAGYIPLGDRNRVTHDRMIEAVEAAIKSLLSDKTPTGLGRLRPRPTPAEWKAFHASIDEDGNFESPPEMTKELPPVVLHSMASHQPYVNNGIFDRVRAIALPSAMKGYSQSSRQCTPSGNLSNRSSYRNWLEENKIAVRKRPRLHEDAAEVYVGAFKGSQGSGGKKPRLD